MAYWRSGERRSAPRTTPTGPCSALSRSRAPSTAAGPAVSRSGGAGRLSYSVIGDAVNLCSRVEEKTRETGDSVLITEATRTLLSETMEVEPRGEVEIRGYSEPIALYAPLIPEVVSPGEPGHDVSDPLARPADVGLGRAVPAGSGLGQRPASGLGRPASGERGRSTLPGA